MLTEGPLCDVGPDLPLPALMLPWDSADQHGLARQSDGGATAEDAGHGWALATMTHDEGATGIFFRPDSDARRVAAVRRRGAVSSHVSESPRTETHQVTQEGIDRLITSVERCRRIEYGRMPAATSLDPSSADDTSTNMRPTCTRCYRCRGND